MPLRPIERADAEAGLSDLAAQRAASQSEASSVEQRARRLGVNLQDVLIPAGDIEIVATVFSASHPQPGTLFYIHGGGQVSGDRFTLTGELVDLVAEIGVRAVSVEYRLSPEFPFPAAIDDCYRVLEWAFDTSHAESPFVVFGVSAGAGLAASMTLLARETDRVRIDAQLLSQPMLDHRTVDNRPGLAPGPHTWTVAHNRDAWGMILRNVELPGLSSVASPSLLHSFVGLPQAFIDIGTHDIFFEEALRYAEKLRDAGVPTESHVWTGAYHGFDVLDPEAEISRLAVATRRAWLHSIFS